MILETRQDNESRKFANLELRNLRKVCGLTLIFLQWMAAGRKIKCGFGRIYFLILQYGVSVVLLDVAAPVAQLDRASVYGTEGCVFESRQAYFHKPLLIKDLHFTSATLSTRKNRFLTEDVIVRSACSGRPSKAMASLNKKSQFQRSKKASHNQPALTDLTK